MVSVGGGKGDKERENHLSESVRKSEQFSRSATRFLEGGRGEKKTQGGKEGRVESVTKKAITVQGSQVPFEKVGGKRTTVERKKEKNAQKKKEFLTGHPPHQKQQTRREKEFVGRKNWGKRDEENRFKDH